MKKNRIIFILLLLLFERIDSFDIQKAFSCKGIYSLKTQKCEAVFTEYNK